MTIPFSVKRALLRAFMKLSIGLFFDCTLFRASTDDVGILAKDTVGREPPGGSFAIHIAPQGVYL